MKAQNDKEVREMVVARGAAALTDAQLLSLLMPTIRGEDNLAIAEKLLAESSLTALSHSSLAELRQLQGLGIERALRLTAAFELGRRMLLAEGEEQRVIHSSADVVTLFKPLLTTLDHEEMWVLYLSTSNRIIERRRLSIGGLSSLSTDCKLILRHALSVVAASIIVVHNHPSGAAEPSAEDLQFTRRLKEAADLFDISLLDHIVIARGGGSYSFRTNGNL